MINKTYLGVIGVVFVMAVGVWRISFSEPEVTKAQYEYIKRAKELGVKHIEFSDGRIISTDLAIEEYEGVDKEPPVAPRYKPGEKVKSPIADWPEEMQEKARAIEREKRANYVKSLERDVYVKGRVIDQYKQPVEGAEVYVNIQYNDPSTYITLKSAHEQLILTTDHNGKFEIDKKKVTGYSIKRITKQNYEITTRYDLEGMPGSPDRVLVFYAYQLPEEKTSNLFIDDDSVFGLPPDGTIYSVSLVKGKKYKNANQGQLQMSIKREESDDPKAHVDWEVMLEVTGGGIVETTDKYMYEAPESGYKEKWTFKMDKGNENWTSTIKKKFYVKANNGKIYSALDAEIYSTYNYNKRDSAIYLKMITNYQGSRNLYYKKN